MFCDRPF
ncbi:hypothetical protein CP8484711_2190, partial [Chlamydia psittaci 84-8471/1]